MLYLGGSTANSSSCRHCQFLLLFVEKVVVAFDSPSSIKVGCSCGHESRGQLIIQELIETLIESGHCGEKHSRIFRLVEVIIHLRNPCREFKVLEVVKLKKRD